MTEFEKEMIKGLIEECRKKQLLAYGNDRVACNDSDLTDYKVIATGLIRSIKAHEKEIEINEKLEKIGN